MKYRSVAYTLSSAINYAIDIKVPPANRTIFIDEKTTSYFLPFPELLFRIYFLLETKIFYYDALHCFFCKDNKNYIPPLPNIFKDGSVCLNADFESFLNIEELIEEVLTLFWTIPFASNELGQSGIYHYCNKFCFENKDGKENVKFILDKWKNNPQAMFRNLILAKKTTHHNVHYKRYKHISSTKEIKFEAF